VPSIQVGVQMAKDAIASGKAKQKLDELITLSQTLAG
jgi:anthranilate phosphoribosyltransferase